MNLAEVIGFLAGTLGMFNALPQVRLVRALGHGEGVSVTAWMLTFIVNACWAGYGIRFGSPSIILTNTIAGILAASVLVALLGMTARVILGLSAATAVFVAAALMLPDQLITSLLIALTFSRLPQVWESYRSWLQAKPTAVSFGSLMMTLFSLIGWAAFSVLQQNRMMMTTTGIAMVLAIAITAFEIGAGRRSALATSAAEAYRENASAHAS